MIQENQWNGPFQGKILKVIGPNYSQDKVNPL